MFEKPLKKLNARDLAFGIGRSATSEELRELISRPTGKLQDGKKVLREIKAHLKSRREKKKAS